MGLVGQTSGPRTMQLYYSDMQSMMWGEPDRPRRYTLR